jgi:S-DNA-T family DNA segregation ATPase FtsK/SpoIIIE
MRKRLEGQADQIESTLAAYRIPARVTGGTVTPRWVRFQVLPAVGSKLSKIRQLNNELAAALGVPDCRVARRGAALDVEIPRDTPKTVQLLPLLAQLIEGGDAIPPVTATLGLADDGAPLLIRLPSPDVGHVLVCGMEGVGKTMLLRDIALSLAMTNGPETLRVVGIDLDGDLGTLTGLPHLARSVIQDDAVAVEALRSLMRLMAFRENSAGTSELPVIVVIVNGLTNLLATEGDIVNMALSQILQQGQRVGIHVVAATRDPAELDGFPVRILGKMQSATDARTASGWTGTGAERLQGSGDFIAVAEGRVSRFQAAHVSTAEIGTVIDRLQSRPTLLSDRALADQPTTVQTAMLPSPVGKGGTYALS